MTMERSIGVRVFVLASALCFGGLVAAEPEATKEAPPQSSEPAAPPSDQTPANESTPPRGTGIEVAPSERSAAGTSGAVLLPDIRPSTGEVLPEGALLLRRRGWVRPITGGSFLYIFDKDAKGESESPMVLLPCQRLTEIVRIVQARPETVTFSVTGQVHVYEGRNYFMPTSFTTVTRENDEDRRREAVKAAGPEIERLFGRSALDEDPAVSTLVERVDQASAKNTTDRPAPAAATTIPQQLRREGTMLVSQRGRLVRSSEGWAFTIDNDAGASPTNKPIGMTLLPCQNLETMAQLIERHGERLVFTISGPLFVFREHNYVLPTMYLIEVDREGNITSAQ